jgi:hypothetical protein
MGNMSFLDVDLDKNKETAETTPVVSEEGNMSFLETTSSSRTSSATSTSYGQDMSFLESEDSSTMKTIDGSTSHVEVDDGIMSGVAKGIFRSIPEAIDNSALFLYDVLPKEMQEFLDETDKSIIEIFGGDEQDVDYWTSPTLLGDEAEKITGPLNTAGEITKDISKVVLTFALTRRFAPKDLGALKTLGVNTLRMIPGDLLFWSKNDKHISDLAADHGIQNALVDFLKNDPNDPLWYHNLKGAVENAFVGTGLEAAGRLLLFSYKGLHGYIRSNSSSEKVANEIVAAISKEPIVPSAVPNNIKAVANKASKNKPPFTQINYNRSPLDNQGWTELLLNSKTVRAAYNLDVKPQALTEVEAKELQKFLGSDGTIELAEGTLKNLKDLDTITLALRRELYDSSKRMSTAGALLLKETGEGQEKLIMKYLFELDNFTRLAKNVKGIQTETARSQAAMRIFSFDDSKLRAVMDVATDHPEQFDDIMRNLGDVGMGKGHIDAALDVIRKIEAGESVLQAGKKAIKEDSKGVKVLRVLLENMYNGILSNPVTHKINMIGNSAAAVARMVEHYTASVVGHTREGVSRITGKVPVGGNDYIRLNELNALHKGQLSAMWDTYRVIANAVKHLPEGTASFEEALQKGLLTNVGKLDEDAAVRYLSADYLNVEGKAGYALDVAGTLNRPALIALGIEDDFFKRMAFNSHANYMAVREANKKGLKEVARKKYIADFLKVIDMQQTIKKGGKLTPASYRLVAKIDGTKRFYDEAILQAKEVTFQEDLGKVGQDFIALKKDAFGGVGNVLMPFVKTPSNLIKWMMRRTPGLNLLSNKSKAMWAKGGRDRDLVIAQLTLGSSLYGLAYNMYKENKITGIAPQGHREAWESAGILESSYVTEDGRTIQHKRADPISTFFNITASLGQYFDEANRRGLVTDEQFIEHWDEVTFAFISAFTENTLNKTYTTGITEFLRAMDDPSPEKWRKYAKQKALMFAPYSGMARYLSEDSEENRKLAITLIEKFADLYGLRDDLPDRPDHYGKVAPRPAKFGGVQQRKITDSPIRIEVARLGIRLPSMSPNISYDGVPIELSTKDLSAMRRLLDTRYDIETALSEYVDSSWYKSLEHDGIDWSLENTKRHALKGELQRWHKEALEYYLDNNKEAMDKYVAGYYKRVANTLSNKPMAVQRWLPPQGGTDTQGKVDAFLGN